MRFNQADIEASLPIRLRPWGRKGRHFARIDTTFGVVSDLDFIIYDQVNQSKVPLKWHDEGDRLMPGDQAKLHRKVQLLRRSNRLLTVANHVHFLYMKLPAEVRMQKFSGLVNRLKRDLAEAGQRLLAAYNVTLALEGLRPDGDLAIRLAKSHDEHIFGFNKIHNNLKRLVDEIELVLSLDIDVSMD